MNANVTITVWRQKKRREDGTYPVTVTFLGANGKRRTVRGLSKNIRATAVSPVSGSKRPVEALATVGCELTPEQARALGINLLATATEAEGARPRVSRQRRCATS